MKAPEFDDAYERAAAEDFGVMHSSGVPSRDVVEARKENAIDLANHLAIQRVKGALEYLASAGAAPSKRRDARMAMAHIVERMRDLEALRRTHRARVERLESELELMRNRLDAVRGG